MDLKTNAIRGNSVFYGGGLHQLTTDSPSRFIPWLHAPEHRVERVIVAAPFNNL